MKREHIFNGVSIAAIAAMAIGAAVNGFAWLAIGFAIGGGVMIWKTWR